MSVEGVLAKMARSAPRAAWRRLLGLIAAGLLAGSVAACHKPAAWHGIDVSGALPPLNFTMTSAATGQPVTAADYGGKVVMLYFGYTHCPDVCPLTLSNIARALKRLGPLSSKVAVLFVTVDPNRDSLAVLKHYTSLFAPEITGLRGTPDQLAALARRYRVAYSVTPAHGTEPYEVTHGAGVYVFDQSGAARLVISSLHTAKPDIPGAADDLKRLATHAAPKGLFGRIMAFFGWL